MSGRIPGYQGSVQDEEESSGSSGSGGRFSDDRTGGRPSDSNDSDDDERTDSSTGSGGGRFSDDPAGGRPGDSDESDQSDSSSVSSQGRFGDDPTGGRPSNKNESVGSGSSESNDETTNATAPKELRTNENYTTSEYETEVSEEEATIAELDRSQFDPTTRSGIQEANLEGERRKRAAEQASNDLGVPESEIEFARQDDELIAYRDPQATEESLERRAATQLGLDAQAIEYQQGELRLTDHGTTQLQRNVQRDAASDLENFRAGDLETNIRQNGQIDVSVQDRAKRRELVERVQEQNQDVTPSEIDFSQEDGNLTARVDLNGSSGPEPDVVETTKSEVSELVGGASSPRDVGSAVATIGGEAKDQAIEQQLGEEFLVDPREVDSASEFVSRLGEEQQEQIEVTSTDDLSDKVTDPVKVERENFDDPGAAAGDLASYYSEETGVTPETVNDASNTVLSPTTGTGGLGTAALAGIAAPEPTSTVGGLIVGTAVVGAAAIRQSQDQSGEVEVPENPSQVSESELGIGGTITDRSELPVEESTGTTSEVSVPENPAQSSEQEISVPDQTAERTDSQILRTGAQQQQRQRQINEETEDPREIDEGEFIIVDEGTIEQNRQQIIREDLERQQRLWNNGMEETREIQTGESAVVDGAGVRESPVTEEGSENPFDQSQGNEMGVGQSSRVGPLEAAIPVLDSQQEQAARSETALQQGLGLRLDSQLSTQSVSQTTAVESPQVQTEYGYQYGTGDGTPRPPRLDVPDFSGGDGGDSRRDEDGTAAGYTFDFADPITGDVLETDSEENPAFGSFL